jgi:P-type Cu+ transporter
MTTTLYADIAGMHCAACVQRVENELRRTPGIVDASVNLMTNRATMVVESDTFADGSIEEAIKRAGYETEAVYSERVQPNADRERARREATLDELRADLRLSVPATVIVMGVSMAAMIPAIEHDLHQDWIAYGLLLLTLPVLWAGRRFFAAAWNGLLHRSMSMDTLVSVGTGAAFLYSAASVIAPSLIPGADEHVGAYFDTTATIITLVLVGKFLEARAKGKAADALQRLMELRPPTARVRRNGMEVDVDIDQVRRNDAVVVRPGERIPVDGIILEGHTTIDESMVTGESMPVERSVNAPVIGGTLNGMGAIVLQATAVGNDTVLAGIIAAVERAQSGKAPIQRLADRISGIFVPVVMGIAALTFMGWMLFGPEEDLFMHALQAAIAVLIIACPCALGLATPTAIMVGTGVAAEHGILFSSPESVELLHTADVVVLDKTGTLTAGTPRVVGTAYVADVTDPADLWSSIVALERRSEHPVARALSTPPTSVQGAMTERSVERSEAVVGKGTIGTVQGVKVRIGTEELMSDALLLIPDGLRQAAHAFAERGATAVYVAIAGRVLAAVGVADTLRPTSVDAVRALHARGKDVVLLSGDHQAVARAIAAEAGIEQVIAGVRPDQKAKHIERLQHAGKRVIMVGDGINDAPALAQADVGVAMGGGTDAAKATADVTLVRDDLATLVSGIDASAATMKTIRQNLFFAFGYNVLGIPIAAGLLYPFTDMLLSPMIAAAAMALSSVTVVTNALRLRTALS